MRHTTMRLDLVTKRVSLGATEEPVAPLDVATRYKLCCCQRYGQMVRKQVVSYPILHKHLVD